MQREGGLVLVISPSEEILRMARARHQTVVLSSEVNPTELIRFDSISLIKLYFCDDLVLLSIDHHYLVLFNMNLSIIVMMK